jgi:ParB family chromosome partitioning protein
MTHPTHVAIQDLKLDEKANVRKTGTGAEAAFLANIEAKGILVPLTVRKNGTGYLVINGGKRLAALQQLAKTGRKIEGKPADAYLVPIHVRDEDDASARDTSLASNIIVAPMHPVDRYEAFAQQVKDGASHEQLQTNYAMTKKQVEQVLALSALSPELRQAWREGKIDAEIAQAFTLAPDHKTQVKTYERLQKDADETDWNDGKIDIGDVIGAFKVNLDDCGRLVEFVGVEAYEARGGKVKRDLFGIEHTASNPKLAKAMANERLEEECKKLVTAGWSWAILKETVKGEWNYGRVDDKDGEYSDAQKAKSGCFVSVDNDGELHVAYGRVKPAEKAAAAAVERKEKQKEKPKSKSAQDKKPNLQISGNTLQALTRQLTEAVSATLASNPELGIPALLAGFASGEVVRIDGQAGKRVAFDAAFDMFRNADHKRHKETIAKIAGSFVHMVPRTYGDAPLKHKGNLALCEALGAPLYVTLKSKFDAKEYFNAVNRHIACKQMKEMFGKGYQASWENEKKAKIEKIAVTKAKETGWLPPELRTSFYAPKVA